MKGRLDNLGTRAVQETTVKPPSHQWLEARRTRRRRGRRLGAGAVGLVILGGGLGGLLVRSSSPQLTEAVATTDSVEEAGQPTRPANEPAPADDEEEQPATTSTIAGPLCGNWPDSFELWPDRQSGLPVDTMDRDGRSVRRQSIDGYTLEIRWPPFPQVDYDFEHETPSESRFTTAQGDDVTRLGISPGGNVDSPTPEPAAEEFPGLEFMRLSADDPTLTSLEGDCVSFEFRLFEGQQLIERIGLGFGSLGEDIVSTDQSGREFTSPGQFDWLELEPIVVEQRTVDTIPGSVTCDGVLVDVDTTTYRVDEPVPQSATLAEAIASGHLSEITEPLTETETAEPTETWAVLLPEAPTDATLTELNRQGFLSYIDGSFYEDFIDPETGPTAGPGVVGSFPESIDALKAFFTHPAAESFTKAGLVELIVDESTYAYGVPKGHGTDGWITVISVENNGGGWLVTGWTSAGC